MKKIIGFDALRAISVTLVILSHAGIIASVSSPALKSFFTAFNANTGVTIFFVLSGFLITTLLRKEKDAAGRINIPHFFARRALRILPLYYLAIIIAAFVSALNIQAIHPSALVHAITYTYNFVQQSKDVNFLSHLWSLAVEEQFYLMWPFVIAALSPKPYRLAIFCILIIAACCMFLVVSTQWDVLSRRFYLTRWFIPAALPILVGCLFAIMLHAVIYKASIQTALASPLALAVSLSAVFCPLWLSPTTHSFFSQLSVVFGIGTLVSWISLNQASIFVKCLDWGPIGYLGKISYGLYVWQGILTGNGPYRETLHWPPPPVLGAILTLIVAPMSYHFFEKRFLSLKSRFATEIGAIPPRASGDHRLQGEHN